MTVTVRKLVLTLVLSCGLSCTVWSASSGNGTSTSNPTSTPRKTSPASASTVPSGDSCRDRNSCSECTKNVKCYWCGANDTCKEYPSGKIVPSDCSGNKWYWKQCVVPGYVLIIVVPVVCGVFLLSIGCCIYCCCCRSRNSQNYRKEDSKFRWKKEEMRQRNAERRAERKLKTDAIRKKYGLLKSDDDDDVVA